jgi:GNAT superfamily N-acetyltransferase
LLEHFIHVGEAEQFSVVATMLVGGFETIVGEARYAFHADTASIEFGLSIDDRWQGHGIGTSLLKNLECRAASFGAGRLFGDTLRSNDAMIALARKAGYAFTNTPGDWKLTRFQKEIPVEPQEIPCASWRLAAVSPSAMSSLAV